MKFARVRYDGKTRPVVLSDGHVYALDDRIPDLDADSLGRLPEVTGWLADNALPDLGPEPDPADYAAPAARVGAVIAIGMNYAAHAAESGASPPERPVMFLKTPNTIGGPNDPVRIPPHSRKTDWEVELAFVIGRRAYELSDDDDPLDYIAGFTVANDLSERTFQLEESGGQWSKGKCLPGYTPLGPWLVTPDKIDHRNLRLRSFVNDEPRQDSSTADLIFDVPTIIRHLSHYLALEPGDVVLTGTPEGVALSGRFPYLVPGDVVRIEIEGLGSQTQQMTGDLDGA